MKTKFIIGAWILLFGFVGVFAQNGGKADAKRIKFVKGKSSATVSGKVYGDVQAEYVFSAKKGQKVNLKIASVPKGYFTAFKVINADGAPEFFSDLDVNYDFAFAAPYSGDYMVWVNFRPAGKVVSAKYNLTVGIK